MTTPVSIREARQICAKLVKKPVELGSEEKRIKLQALKEIEQLLAIEQALGILENTSLKASIKSILEKELSALKKRGGAEACANSRSKCNNKKLLITIIIEALKKSLNNGGLSREDKAAVRKLVKWLYNNAKKNYPLKDKEVMSSLKHHEYYGVFNSEQSLMASAISSLDDTAFEINKDNKLNLSFPTVTETRVNVQDMLTKTCNPEAEVPSELPTIPSIPDSIIAPADNEPEIPTEMPDLAALPGTEGIILEPVLTEAEIEAEKAAKLEAEKAAKLEAEKAAKLEAEKAAKLEAEKAAKLEAQKAAKLEAAKKAKLEAELAAQLELEPVQSPYKLQLPFLPDWVNLGARLGFGLGGFVSGRIHGPQVLSDKERGIITNGSFSISAESSENTLWQLDYHSTGPYDIFGENDILFNNDDVRVSFIGENLLNDIIRGIFIQAGYRYYRNDFPSTETPDFNGLLANARANINLGSEEEPEFASLNIGANLLAGQTNTVLFGEKGNFDFVSTEGDLGVSFNTTYKNAKIFPYVGVLGGYSQLEDQGALGAYAGLRLAPESDSWEVNIDLNGHFVGQQNLNPIGRLFVNVNEYFAIGGQVSGDIRFDQASQKAGLGLTALITPIDSFKAFTIQPFFNADTKFEGSVKPAILSVGVTLRLGNQGPARLSSLRRDSIKTLPEEE